MISLRTFVVIVVIAAMGLLGSVITGLVSRGSQIFELMNPGFAFISFGISGAAIFAFYHARGLSDAITTAAIISSIQFAVSMAWITPLNAAMWSFGVNGPVVVLAFLFERRLGELRRARFLFNALMYGVGFVLLSFFTGWFAGIETMPALAFRENFVDGFLIGLGIGMGVELGEVLLHSWEVRHPIAAHR